MDKFRTCHRCDAKYFLKRYICKECGFIAFNEFRHKGIKNYFMKDYQFTTENYVVLVYKEGRSNISSKKNEKNNSHRSYWVFVFLYGACFPMYYSNKIISKNR